MKKNWFLLLMITLFAFFTSCSDDEEQSFVVKDTIEFDFMPSADYEIVLNIESEWYRLDLGNGETFTGSDLVNRYQLEYSQEEYGKIFKVKVEARNFTGFAVQVFPKGNGKIIPKISNMKVGDIPTLTFFSTYLSDQVKLDLNNCPNLKSLHLSNSPSLKTVAINKCLMLENLTFYEMKALNQIDLSTNNALVEIQSVYGNLNSLKMPSNAHKLESFNCYSNNLSKEMLNRIFQYLPQTARERATLAIDGNPGTETCDRGIAEEKGWEFVPWMYEPE